MLGNHELAEWTGRSIGKDGVPQNQLFALGVEAAYGPRAAELLEGYRHLYAAMALAVRTKNRVFITHSIPPGAQLDRFDPGLFDHPCVPEHELRRGSSLYHLVWGRDVSEETARRFTELIDANLLVTGHISCKSGYRVPNSRQLILDSTGSSGCCVLFPGNGQLTHQQLIEQIVPLSDD